MLYDMSVIENLLSHVRINVSRFDTDAVIGQSAMLSMSCSMYGRDAVVSFE